MPMRNVFGALRATSIAALCAGAGLALAGCGKTESTTIPDTKSSVPGAKATVEKAGGEHSCGGDKQCSPNGCSAKK